MRPFKLNPFVMAALAIAAPGTALATPAVDALPVVDGAPIGATVFGASGGNSMTVRQTAGRSVINWQSFSIGEEADVHYDFTTNNLGGGVSLNRVTGGNLSEIYGALTADGGGKIFLINPTGIVFGQSAYVDVGSLIATTASITDTAFCQGACGPGGPAAPDPLVGTYNFTASNGTGAVVNNGHIYASAPAGYIILAANQVENGPDAILSATGIGNHVTLVSSGDFVVGNGALVSYELPASALQDPGVVNSGYIYGANIALNARTVGDLSRLVVNNSGFVRAASIVSQNEQVDGGTITLVAEGGSIENSGTLDASGINATSPFATLLDDQGPPSNELPTEEQGFGGKIVARSEGDFTTTDGSLIDASSRAAGGGWAGSIDLRAGNALSLQSGSTVHLAASSNGGQSLDLTAAQLKVEDGATIAMTSGGYLNFNQTGTGTFTVGPDGALSVPTLESLIRDGVNVEIDAGIDPASLDDADIFNFEYLAGGGDIVLSGPIDGRGGDDAPLGAHLVLQTAGKVTGDSIALDDDLNVWLRGDGGEIALGDIRAYDVEMSGGKSTVIGNVAAGRDVFINNYTSSSGDGNNDTVPDASIKTGNITAYDISLVSGLSVEAGDLTASDGLVLGALQDNGSIATGDLFGGYLVGLVAGASISQEGDDIGFPNSLPTGTSVHTGDVTSHGTVLFYTGGTIEIGKLTLSVPPLDQQDDDDGPGFAVLPNFVQLVADKITVDSIEVTSQSTDDLELSAFKSDGSNATVSVTHGLTADAQGNLYLAGDFQVGGDASLISRDGGILPSHKIPYFGPQYGDPSGEFSLAAQNIDVTVPANDAGQTDAPFTLFKLAAANDLSIGCIGECASFPHAGISAERFDFSAGHDASLIDLHLRAEQSISITAGNEVTIEDAELELPSQIISLTALDDDAPVPGIVLKGAQVYFANSSIDAQGDEVQLIATNGDVTDVLPSSGDSEGGGDEEEGIGSFIDAGALGIQASGNIDLGHTDIVVHGLETQIGGDPTLMPRIRDYLEEHDGSLNYLPDHDLPNVSFVTGAGKTAQVGSLRLVDGADYVYVQTTLGQTPWETLFGNNESRIDSVPLGSEDDDATPYFAQFVPSDNDASIAITQGGSNLVARALQPADINLTTDFFNSPGNTIALGGTSYGGQITVDDVDGEGDFVLASNTGITNPGGIQTAGFVVPIGPVDDGEGDGDGGTGIPPPDDGGGNNGGGGTSPPPINGGPEFPPPDHGGGQTDPPPGDGDGGTDNPPGDGDGGTDNPPGDGDGGTDNPPGDGDGGTDNPPPTGPGSPLTSGQSDSLGAAQNNPAPRPGLGVPGLGLLGSLDTTISYRSTEDGAGLICQ